MTTGVGYGCGRICLAMQGSRGYLLYRSSYSRFWTFQHCTVLYILSWDCMLDLKTLYTKSLGLTYSLNSVCTEQCNVGMSKVSRTVDTGTYHIISRDRVSVCVVVVVKGPVAASSSSSQRASRSRQPTLRLTTHRLSCYRSLPVFVATRVGWIPWLRATTRSRIHPCLRRYGWRQFRLCQVYARADTDTPRFDAFTTRCAHHRCRQQGRPTGQCSSRFV